MFLPSYSPSILTDIFAVIFTRNFSVIFIIIFTDILTYSTLLPLSLLHTHSHFPFHTLFSLQLILSTTHLSILLSLNLFHSTLPPTLLSLSISHTLVLSTIAVAITITHFISFSLSLTHSLPLVLSTIAVAISPDGETVATSHGDHTIKIFKYYTGEKTNII